MPYYLKWADAVIITYSIIQQDSFEMALAYLDAINVYSKNLSFSNNSLVIILLGNKLDLERIRYANSRELQTIIFSFSRVIPKSEGESIAAKFQCGFCETTAADDYEYVQQLFHRTVREVRKERERTVASNTIDEEQTHVNIPSPSSSVSSNSSSIENEKISSSNIPLPPPIPATLAHKAAHVAKTIKQPDISTQTISTSPTKTSQQPTVTTAKRTPSKSSVFSKIFK